MSTTTSGAPKSAWTSESPQSESPRRELADFLTKESSRYVPFPYLSTCDAIFVHRWFESNLFAPASNPQSRKTERLFELMNPEYAHATIMGIKHLVLNRHRDRPGRFRLRWSKEDEDTSEVFLISCFGLPEHVAVVPTSYMRRRYGDVRNIEGHFEPDQPCPSLLAPFMVHHQDIVKFLEEIYEHACTSATSDLVNPTYSATYYGWIPELQRLKEVMPTGGYLDKLLSMRDLYFACHFGKQTMRLSRRGEPGHFVLDGHAVEYWRKSWCRRGDYGDYIRVTLLHQLSGKSPWKFLLLEDQSEREALLLPRNLVPSHLIGHTRHGRLNNSAKRPQVEVAAGRLAPFIFAIRTPHHTATTITSIMRNYTNQAEFGAGQGFGDQDSGYDSSIPRRTRSGMEDWILELVHKSR